MGTSVGQDEPDEPEEPHEPEEPSVAPKKPKDSEIRVPRVFKQWMNYPETLDIGVVSMVRSIESIAVTWLNREELSALPRFESGDRFARLVFIIGYVLGEWATIHGEHMRKQGGTDETGGATLDMWEEHTTLGQTMRAKSKDEAVRESGYEPGPGKPIGVMVVTHDQNQNPQRTKVHWFGEFEDGEDPQPEDPGEVRIPDAEIRRIFRRAAELMR